MSLSPADAPNVAASPIIGIDLGTTNSLVAIVEKGVPVVLPDPQTGETLVPSVVYFPYGSQAPVVGVAARPYLTAEPNRTVYSAKRLMGKGLNDAYGQGENLPYRLSPEYKDAVRIDLGAGHVVSAPEVGALVLRSLKERAEAHLGQPVTKAVVTVPAYFNDAERQATKDAGTIAGLEIVRIVNEPTAASLAYGLQNSQAATIAVYDLGGGTFDISILRLEDGVFEVLATGGDTHLGGDDFDNRLTDWLLLELNPLGADIERAEARVSAESAKRLLSTSTTAEILGVVVTRDKFEELIASLINRTLAACQQTLKDAGLNPSEIDQVVLVGGSTRVPAVRRAVGQLFGKTPHTNLNPDEVVALGAAIQADILSGNRSDLLLLDVTPLSLGLETMGGATEKLLFRNTKIPATAREEFTTSVDGQTTVLLHIVQGEREMANDNRSLARLQLAGIPPMPAGIPKIEVVFLLDANGILQVSAKETRSGAKTDVRIQPSYGLGETEVKRMVRESFRFADEDFKNRMLADMRNEADAALNGGAKLLAAHGAELEESVRTAIERDLAALKAARDTAPDHAQVRKAMDAFEETARPLAELAMSGIAKELVGGKSLDQARDYLDERIKEERPDEDGEA